MTIRFVTSALLFNDPWWPCIYLEPLWRYGILKITGSRCRPLAVTWCHRSRDQSTRGGPLPMGGPLWPCVYLAPLRRHGTSKDNEVMTLLSCGHMTSLVTWPFDSQWATSYEWSVVTMCLSCTIIKIWHLKCWTHTRTHGWTLRWFYTLSNAMHRIAHTITPRIMSTIDAKLFPCQLCQSSFKHLSRKPCRSNKTRKVVVI